jgi:hypothetical protein
LEDSTCRAFGSQPALAPNTAVAAAADTVLVALAALLLLLLLLLLTAASLLLWCCWCAAGVHDAPTLLLPPAWQNCV